MGTLRCAPHGERPAASSGGGWQLKMGPGSGRGVPQPGAGCACPSFRCFGQAQLRPASSLPLAAGLADLSFQPEDSQCWRAPERRAAGTHAGLLTLSCVPGQPPAPPVTACLGAIPSWAGHIHPLLASCCPEHPMDRLRAPCALPCCVQARVLPAKGQTVRAVLGRGALQDQDPWLGSAQTRAGGGPGHRGLAAGPVVPRSPASAGSQAPQCSVCQGPVPCGIPQTSPAGSRELCSQQLGRIDASIRHQYGEGAGRSPGFDQAGTEEADISHQRPVRGSDGSPQDTEGKSGCRPAREAGMPRGCVPAWEATQHGMGPQEGQGLGAAPGPCRALPRGGGAGEVRGAGRC